MALACRFRIRSIHSQWRITPPPADSTQTILRLRSVLHLRGPDSRPVCVTQLWKRDYVATRLQPITTNSPAVSKVLWESLETISEHGNGKQGSVITKIVASSALAETRTATRCGLPYSTPIPQPPSTHLALTGTRPQCLIEFLLRLSASAPPRSCSKISSYTATFGIFQQGQSPLRSAANTEPSAKRTSRTR